MSLALLLLFSLIVLSGLFIVYSGIRRHKSIPALGNAHGLMALTAFGLLLYYIANAPASKTLNFAAIMFFLALTGGGLLFALREKDSPPSMPLVIIHAILALSGFGLLLSGLLQTG